MSKNIVNNEGNLNSQSPRAEEEDPQKLEADSMLLNTEKHTIWDLKKLGCDLHFTR